LDIFNILIFNFIPRHTLKDSGINFSNLATFSNANTEIVDVKIIKGIVKYDDENNAKSKT
jgi:hypothetical protein